MASDAAYQRGRWQAMREGEKQAPSGWITCACCSTPIGKAGYRGRPQGRAICNPCRRALKASYCVAPRPPKKRSLKPRKRRPHLRSTTERGYGAEHQKAREAALDAFRPGDLCARCGGPILPTHPVDLDHTDDRLAYLGLSHRWCNRATSRQRVA